MVDRSKLKPKSSQPEWMIIQTPGFKSLNILNRLIKIKSKSYQSEETTSSKEVVPGESSEETGVSTHPKGIMIGVLPSSGGCLSLWHESWVLFSSAFDLSHQDIQVTFLGVDIFLRNKRKLVHWFGLWHSNNFFSPIVNSFYLLINLGNSSAVSKIVYNELHIFWSSFLNFFKLSIVTLNQTLLFLFLLGNCFKIFEDLLNFNCLLFIILNF